MPGSLVPKGRGWDEKRRTTLRLGGAALIRLGPGYWRHFLSQYSGASFRSRVKERI